MSSQIQSTIPVRSTRPTHHPRRHFGVHLATVLLAVAAQTACDAPMDEDAGLVAPAAALQDLEEALQEADPHEQNSELEDTYIEAHIEAMGPGELTIALAPPTAAYPTSCFNKAVDYEITFKTGNMLYAGTNAKVSFSFRGAGEKWTSKMTESGVGYFERGSEDTLYRNFKSLGVLDKMSLSHNNTGIQAGWYVEWVRVHDTCSDLTWQANVDRWFDTKPGLSASRSMVTY